MPDVYKTPLEDGMDYKQEVIARLTSSQTVVGLLLDDPKVDLESDATYKAVANCIFDYDYMSKTVERSDALIMVDADMISPASGTFNNWELYVQIVCHKGYMALQPKVFKGVKGNRRDNLVNEVDKLLNGTMAFGVGELQLVQATTAVVPDSWTSKLLTYQIKEIRRERYGGKFK